MDQESENSSTVDEETTTSLDPVELILVIVFGLYALAAILFFVKVRIEGYREEKEKKK